MSIEENVRVVKDFFAAMGSGDKQALLALVAEDLEWIIPGEDWPLAGTHRGHAGLAATLRKASEEVEMTYPKPPEFVAQGDRVLAIGVAVGKIKATDKPFEDHWVFDITLQNGKLKSVREYIDTQALARASETDASPQTLTPLDWRVSVSASWLTHPSGHDNYRDGQCLQIQSTWPNNRLFVKRT